MRCPACGRCPFAGGICEDRVNRGRRFFLMGALALPVARPLAKVTTLFGTPEPEVQIVSLGDEFQRLNQTLPDYVHYRRFAVAIISDVVFLRNGAPPPP